MKRTLLFVLFTIFAVFTVVKSQDFQYYTECAFNTGSNASVAVLVDIEPNIDGELLQAGDEIAAWSPQDFCVGRIIWDGENNKALTVWGNNFLTPEIDGMLGGQTILYRVWQQSTDTEYTNVAVTYNQGDGLYQTNGIYVLGSLIASSVDTLGRTFTVVSAPLPDKVVLLEPEDGAIFEVTESIEIPLLWEPALHAEEYEIQIWDDNSCTLQPGDNPVDLCNMYISEVFVTNTEFVFPVAVATITYRWRVRGINQSGAGEWSGN